MTIDIARFLARTAAILAAALLFTAPARAEWHKAESDRFVIYSDSNARDIQEFAERLERYHVAMTFLTGRKVPVPSPSSRVTVYAVGSERTLKQLYGDRNSNVAGFYIPRASGSVAFVPNVKVYGRETDFTLIVLLHEYAHHFTIASTAFAMPRWLTEGSAEFFAAAKFDRDGGIEIGLPASHRIGELNFADEVSVRELIDYDLYMENRGRRYDAYYGRAWLLFHYLHFEPSRRGQVEQYQLAMLRGATSMEAAEDAFGDLDELERDLRSYQRRRRIPAYRLAPEQLPIGGVTVTPLSEGMDAMMDVVIRSRRGVSEEEALELLPEAREVAAEFPQDPGVLAALAEAEFDAGNDAEAVAAADRALALDPGQKNALVQKGYALFRMAEDATDADAAYTRAMAPFTALNQLENDHPLPLIYYYRSFTERGLSPVETARHALERAAMLAPFDQGLRFQASLMLVGERKNTIARAMLAPIAADPHGSNMAERARQLIAALERTPDGTRLDMSPLFQEAEDAGGTESGG